MANRPWGRQQVAFQRAIRRVRKEAGLTQVQMARKLAKPQSYVSKYECGERKLDYLEVKEICACCNITITDFDGVLAQSGYEAPGLPGLP